MKNLLYKIIATLTLALSLSGATALAVEIPFDPEDAGTVEVTVHDLEEYDDSGEDERDEFSDTDSAVNQAGVIQLRAIALNVYYFLKYALVVIAIAFMSLSAFRLVTAGKNIEEEITKAKLNLKWIIYGLIGFLLLDVLVGTFFGHSELAGMIFRDTSDTSVLYETATVFTQELFIVLDFILTLVSFIGVLIIIISALAIIGAFGNESIITHQRKISLVVVGGLVIIALARTVVGRVIFGITGYDEAGDIVTNTGKTILAPEDVGFLVNAKAGTDEIIGIANYILGFVGILALVMFVYGALRMVMAQGDDATIDKAKSIMTSAIIGIIIAVCSFTIVATFINPS